MSPSESMKNLPTLHHFQGRVKALLSQAQAKVAEGNWEAVRTWPRKIDPTLPLAMGLVGLAAAISFSEYRTFRAMEGHLPALTRTPLLAPDLTSALPAPVETPLFEELTGTSSAEEEGPESDPIMGPQKRTFRVDCGDTLSSILREIGISFRDIDAISKALSKHHNVKHLQIGQLLELEWEVENDTSRLKALETVDSLGSRIRLVASESTASGQPRYTVSVQKRELKTEVRTIKGTISSTFDQAARAQGLPSSLVHEVSRAISPLIKTTRLRTNTAFEVVYEEKRDKVTGKLVGKRCLKYVAVMPEGQTPFRVYGFGNQYYTETGESLKTEFLTVPLKDRHPRVSSPFGMRRHPILGVVKRHYGVDYAAKYGSDVYAAANGTVVAAERRGAYGLYVRIRHANGFETAYGHLSRISVKKGQTLAQGDLIGKVGCTGRATGPHLHFELIRSQVRVDPQKYCSLGTTKLKGEELAKFAQFKKTVADELRKSREV